jgi:hypothetical protein
MRDQYFNVKVNAEADEPKAAESIRCYTSSFSQPEMEEMIDFERERPNELTNPSRVKGKAPSHIIMLFARTLTILTFEG